MPQLPGVTELYNFSQKKKKAVKSNPALAGVGLEVNPLRITGFKDFTWLRKPLRCKRLEAGRGSGGRIPTELPWCFSGGLSLFLMDPSHVPKISYKLPTQLSPERRAWVGSWNTSRNMNPNFYSTSQ